MIKLTILISAMAIYTIIATIFAIPELERRVADWGYNRKVASMREYAEADVYINSALKMPIIKEAKDVKRK